MRRERCRVVVRNPEEAVALDLSGSWHTIMKLTSAQADLAAEFTHLAKYFVRTSPAYVPRWHDDLHGAGQEALVNAVASWDPSKTNTGSFQGWLAYRVRFAVIDELRRLNGRRVQRNDASLDQMMAPAEHHPGLEAMSDLIGYEDDEYTDNMWFQTVLANSKLTGYQRDLAGAVWGKGTTLKVLAKEQGVSESRICQRMTKVKAKVLSHVAAMSSDDGGRTGW